MKAVIILGNIEKINKELLSDSFIIGVDKGAYLAYSNNILLDIAIGDFDSITDNELKSIKTISKKVIRLNPIKDKTDTNEAIELCKAFDEIIILGGIKGKRIEHFIANIIEMINDQRIRLIDDNSLIETKNKSFIPNKNYKFMSLYSIESNSNISLSGFKYNLNDYNLAFNDPLCISNEITDNAVVTINSGRVLVIYSKDDNEII